MTQSRSRSRSRDRDERQPLGRERQAELAVEPGGVEAQDQDDQLRRAQARAAHQHVAQPVGQLAIQHSQAQQTQAQQQAARTAGQLAIRATQQGQAQQP
jgi:hypothetical protein